MLETKFVEKIKIQISCSITFLKKSCLYEIIWENTVEAGRPQMTILHAGKPKLQTHTQNMQSLLLLRCNNGYANDSQRHVILMLPVLFTLFLDFCIETPEDDQFLVETCNV
jgi:hypothetical protein